MNGEFERSATTRVRPSIRRLAILAVVILVPVAAHSVWDYIEIRRLAQEIQDIQARREPVIQWDAIGGKISDATLAEAGAYYLAGGMLALATNSYTVTTPIREWLASPSPDRKSLAPLMVLLKETVNATRDAVALADKGAALPFRGFSGGADYSYRAASIGGLSSLIAARTLALSDSGDGDAAVDSMISGLQLRRAMQANWLSAYDDQVAAVLSLSRPSPDALRRLETALAAEDQPDRAIDYFLRDRARYVETYWRRYYGSDPRTPYQYTLPMRSVTETIMRPWGTHQIVENLRMWGEMVQVARLPWPQKADASAALIERYRQKVMQRRDYSNVALGAFSLAVDARRLIVDRSSRVAVAVEEFRRDRGALPSALPDLVPTYLREIPADPYSGRPLLFRSTPGSFTIYSIGPDRKDDSGDLTSVPPRGVGVRRMRGADIGVRVLLQP